MKNVMEGFRLIVGWVGEQIIYGLIQLLGRTYPESEVPWLDGPVGSDHIGERPYEETAEKEGLTLTRHAGTGGLIPDFRKLKSETFDPEAVDPLILDFYEGTAGYTLDTWASTYFPANVALWLLVQTISRRVDQLNFPLDGLDSAKGMSSEVVLLRHPDGAVKYTGWFRRLRSTDKAIYTGFYMREQLPCTAGPVVKTIFPMPGGNATVFLRPENADKGGLRLVSAGGQFGDVGFYRLQKRSGKRVQVWRVRSLHEQFDLYRDGDALRCDHRVKFLGFKVLALHYRITGSPARLENLESV